MTRLSRVLQVQSHSRNYGMMVGFILHELKNKNVSFQIDKFNNILAVKGTGPYPTYACHTDTVHPVRPGYGIFRSIKSHVWGAFARKNGVNEPAGIGGDDKCGIFICLRLLDSMENVKCVFFSDEEIGCIGSSNVDMDWFLDSRFIVQVDRKGKSDIIYSGAGTRLMSVEFKSAVEEIGKKFKYTPTTGSITDVVQLRKRGLPISSMNMSVGYYNPHSKHEHIVERDLFRAYCFALEIGKSLTTRFEYKKVEFGVINCDGLGCNRKLWNEEQISKGKCYECLHTGTCQTPGCTNTVYNFTQDKFCYSCSRAFAWNRFTH